MLSRRALLLGSVAAAACKSPPPAPKKPPALRNAAYEGVYFVELFPNGADESSPVIVAIHGRGDRPENWIPTWSHFPQKAHVLLPTASKPFLDGYSWFEFRDGMTDEEFGAEVGAAEAKLWPALVAASKGRKMLVTGFSQGAFLSFAIASRHGDVVAKAFPVSGSCPGPLLPKPNVKAAPVLAFHGTNDPVVEIKWGRAAVHGFVERGAVAEMKEYEGVGHTITAPERKDLWDAIGAALPLVT